MKTLYTSGAFLCGVTYRVTGNGRVAHVAARRFGSGWKIARRMPRHAFDAWADSVRLFDPYAQNPAKIMWLISEAAE